MKIMLNRSFTPTGPMIFTRRLIDELVRNFSVKIVTSKPDIYFAVIQFKKKDVPKGSKVLLRVDGLYWNSLDRNVKKSNRPIMESIQSSSGVVFQSQFCKRCYKACMGKIHTPNIVILNAIDWKTISSTPVYKLPKLPGLVANASWRPTKRPHSICQGFLSSNINHQLYMIGKIPNKAIKNHRITWLGELDSLSSISVMKACSHAIHLAKFDPCPNSVVEEVCCGLPVLHTANGGTPEIVGGNGIMMDEDEDWNYDPICGVNDINHAKVADYLEKLVLMGKQSPPNYLDIRFAAQKYYDFFMQILNT